MNCLKKLKCLNALDIKLLAMLFMLCDHMWATIIPGHTFLTNIGRMAFPIFAFQIAEGFCKTKNFKKYLGRILLFALISEIPFNIMYSGGYIYPFHQNVLFTFALALLFLKLIDISKKKGTFIYICSVVISLFLGYTIGFITCVDYFGYGVLTVILFYMTRDIKYSHLVQLVGMIAINGVIMKGMMLDYSLLGINIYFPQQAFAVLSLIFIWMYNGSRGPDSRAIRLLTYSFYPVHILVLCIIALFV